jgi:5-oxoprolinase (ATP-hydrolysing)
MSMADVVVEKQEPCNLDLSSNAMKEYIHKRIDHLKNEAIEHLKMKENFDSKAIEIEIFLNLRYKGTDSGIMCSPETNKLDVFELEHSEFEQVFLNK